MQRFLASLALVVLVISGCDTAVPSSSLSQEPHAGLTVSRMCTPITSISCSAWPEQAQIVAKVTTVHSIKSADGEACEVTLAPSVFNAHMLCPMFRTSRYLTYQVCGACPEVGSEVSGVLMKDGFGRVVLDK